MPKNKKSKKNKKQENNQNATFANLIEPKKIYMSLLNRSQVNSVLENNKR
jgi:hypothetical protein